VSGKLPRAPYGETGRHQVFVLPTRGEENRTGHKEGLKKREKSEKNKKKSAGT